jgi:hypothetical protein
MDLGLFAAAITHTRRASGPATHQSSPRLPTARRLGAARSAHKALTALDQALMTRDVNWVLDIDIRSFDRGGGAGHERQGGDRTSIRRG